MKKADRLELATHYATRMVRGGASPADALLKASLTYGLTGAQTARLREALGGRPAPSRGPGRDWRTRAREERFGGGAA